MSMIPTEENPHPLLSIEGVKRKRFVIKSLFITITITLLLYVFLPNYYILESLTTQTSEFFLNLFGFKTRVFVYEDSLEDISFFENTLINLYDPSRATYPAISMDTEYGRSNYLIIRSCTGMQAGALLLGLIWSTPAKLHDKIRSSYIILIALFFGNVLRIAAQIGMTLIIINNFNIDYDTAWSFAHDWTGKPIGFFGTIGFTYLIEKRNVKILDTISVWFDFVLGNKPLPKK